MLFTIKLQAWEAMHACAFRLLCWTKYSGAASFEGCSLVCTFHLCLLLRSHGDSRSHCSDYLSVFCNVCLSVWGLLWGAVWGDSPALYTSSATAGAFSWVSVERPRIYKITHRNVCVLVETLNAGNRFVLKDEQEVRVQKPCSEGLQETNPPKQIRKADRWIWAFPALLSLWRSAERWGLGAPHLCLDSFCGYPGRERRWRWEFGCSGQLRNSYHCGSKNTYFVPTQNC